MGDVVIRPERVSDYSAIAGLNYDAFVNWRPTPFKAEPLLVDILRHNTLFDPDLSLVAEAAGRVVGHVLFSPFEFVVLGTRQMGALLAPIGVEPAFQRSGIGGRLIERGHEVASEKGIAFAILCGHPEYYPRFGYRQRMFSLSGATVRLEARGAQAPDLAERPVLASDLAWIVDAWRRAHGGDALAIFPGDGIAQWFNHAASHRSSVITRGGEPVAYARYKAARPLAFKEFLVRDVAAGDILAFLLGESGRGGGQVTTSLSADALEPLFAPSEGVQVSGSPGTSDAFMLCALDPSNEVLARYCADVSEGRMLPGLIAFPPILDTDE